MERYRARISGPLLDRIDLQVRLGQVDARELVGGATRSSGLDSVAARARVTRAREQQLRRQHCLNSGLGAGETLAHCRADAAALALLARAASSRGTSARGQHRVLRVARSIADLAERPGIGVEEMAEALALRLDD